MAELGPSTIYGDLIVEDDLYIRGTGGLYFNDTDTQVWEDGSGNLTFKDGQAGTITLADLVADVTTIHNDLKLLQGGLLTDDPSDIDEYYHLNADEYAALIGGPSSVADDYHTHDIGGSGTGMPALKYITNYTVSDSSGSPDSLSGANWAVNKSIIKAIKVQTDSTDWGLMLWTNSSAADAGMYDEGFIYIARSASGNQVLLLDLPYIDNDSSNSVHLAYIDEASEGTTAVIDVYGLEATT